MKYNMYAIFDSAIEAYNRPFCARAHGEAIRMFEGQCKEDSPVKQNPEHFSLWFIGTYEEEGGILRPENLTCLVKAHEYIASMENNG